MKLNKRENRVNNSNFKALMIGIGISLVISFLLSALVAWLTGKGVIGTAAMDTLSGAIVFLSTLIGCLWSVWKLDDKVLRYSGLCGAVYIFILTAINIIVFDGQFKGVIGKIVAVIAAAFVSGLFRVRMVTRGSKNKFRFK